MAGCTKAAIEALKAYLYMGEIDFKQLDLDTLLYIMNNEHLSGKFFLRKIY